MKSRTIACSIVVAALGFSSLSFAQPAFRDARHDAREARQDQREARRDLREAKRDLREARQDRRDARRHYHNARGPEFRRGGRLPVEYRQRYYVVNNWHGHHLYAPPRGYHWVQVGSDYVLAAIATGIIANLVFGN
jgi:Ni/Co efflux regulator RcnB